MGEKRCAVARRVDRLSFGDDPAEVGRHFMMVVAIIGLGGECEVGSDPVAKGMRGSWDFRRP